MRFARRATGQDSGNNFQFRAIPDFPHHFQILFCPAIDSFASSNFLCFLKYATVHWVPFYLLQSLFRTGSGTTKCLPDRSKLFPVFSALRRSKNRIRWSCLFYPFYFNASHNFPRSDMTSTVSPWERNLPRLKYSERIKCISVRSRISFSRSAASPTLRLKEISS